VRQTVGPRVELAIRQRLVAEEHRHGLGPQLDLCLDQPVHRLGILVALCVLASDLELLPLSLSE